MDHVAHHRPAWQIWAAWAVLTWASALALSLFLVRASPLVIAAAFSVFLLAVLMASIWPWRALDEVAREAHKAAWYWGGLCGLVIAAGLATGLAHSAGSKLLVASWRTAVSPEQAGGVALGIGLCALAQTLGYGVAWTAWWAARVRR